MDILSTLGLSLVVIYVLVKEVVGPLVRKKRPEANDMGVRLAVFEVNLKTMETRIGEFREVIERNARTQDVASTALDNKLDIVLEELREFRESIASRLTRVETQVETMLRGAQAHRVTGGIDG